MRRLARVALWILGIAFPVFLAACYGPPHSYSRTGNVTENPGDPGGKGAAQTGGDRTSGDQAPAQ